MLQVEELKIGHSDCQSSAERVEFRLEVVDASGTVAAESDLALSGTIAGALTPARI